SAPDRLIFPGAFDSSLRKARRRVRHSLVRCRENRPTGPKTTKRGTPNVKRGPRNARPSVNLYRHPIRHLINNPCRIPVRQPNSAMTSRPPDRIRTICSVNSNAYFVQADPGDSYRVPWPWREVVIILTSLSMIQHRLIPAKPRHRRNTHDSPG